MGTGLSQVADCLPVSFLLLHSSRQAQVCVGSDWVLSNDSNSCCVPALSHAHTHICKANRTTVHLRQTTRMESSYMYSTYQNNPHVIFINFTYTRLYIPQHFFPECVKVYKASYCLQWSLAQGQTKQGSRNRLLLDHAPLWALKSCGCINRYKTAALNKIYARRVIAESSGITSD